MTVSTETARIVYNGNGATTAFPTEFQFYDDADLVVTKVVTATGVETTQTITTHYTVSGGDGSTGTVTMLTAPATGTRLVIQRVSTLIQDTDLIVQGEIPADSVETRFDKLTLFAQEAALDAIRAIRTNKAQTGTIDTEIPLLTDKAGYVIAINDDEDGFTLSNVASLSSSLDAVITSPATDDFLVYTSSAWRNRTAAQALTHLGTISSAAIAAAYQPLDSDLTAIAALDATAGMVSRTGAGAFAVRTLAVGTGLSIADPTGAAGAPTISLGTVLAAYAGGGTPTAAFLTIVDDATVSAILDTLGGASATGSGGVVRATSPTLVTPALGVATATSISFGQSVLNYYGSGTWTPVLTPGSGSITSHDGQNGAYTRVGDRCHVNANVGVNVLGTPTTTLTIAGLPFTPGAGTATYSSVALNPRGWAASLTSPLAGLITNGATVITVYKYAATTGLVTTNVANDLAASCQLELAGHFRV